MPPTLLRYRIRDLEQYAKRFGIDVLLPGEALRRLEKSP
jgi:hypothetical protein